jgi:hypothetical protein
MNADLKHIFSFTALYGVPDPLTGKTFAFSIAKKILFWRNILKFFHLPEQEGEKATFRTGRHCPTR